MSANLMASLLLPSHSTLNRELAPPHSDAGVQGTAFESLLADIDPRSAPISAAGENKNVGSHTQRGTTSADPGAPATSSAPPATNVDAALALLASVVFPSPALAADVAASRPLARSEDASPASPAPAAAALSASASFARRTANANPVFASVSQLAQTVGKSESGEPGPQSSLSTASGVSGSALRTAPSAALAWASQPNANVKMPDLSSLIHSASVRALEAPAAFKILEQLGADAKATPGAALGTLAYVKTNSLDFTPEVGFQSLQTKTHLAVSSVESSAAAEIAAHASIGAGVASPTAATNQVAPAQTDARRTQSAPIKTAAAVGWQRQAPIEASVAAAPTATSAAPVLQTYPRPTPSMSLATAAVVGAQVQAQVKDQVKAQIQTNVEAGFAGAPTATKPVPPEQPYPRQTPSTFMASAELVGSQVQAQLQADVEAGIARAPTETKAAPPAQTYIRQSPSASSTSAEVVGLQVQAQVQPQVQAHVEAASALSSTSLDSTVFAGPKTHANIEARTASPPTASRQDFQTFAPTASLLTATTSAAPRALAYPQDARSASVKTAGTAGSQARSNIEPVTASPTVTTSAVFAVQANLFGQQSASRQTGGEDPGPMPSPGDAVKASQPTQAPAAPVSALATNAGAHIVNLSDLGDRLVHEALGFGAADARTNATLAASPVKELRLNLEPAHLGAVAVTLKMSSGKLSVDVGVANPSALVAVENQRETMISKLQTGAQPLESFVVHQQIFSDAPFSQTSSSPSQAESFGNASGNDKSSPGAGDQTPRQPRTPARDTPPPARNRMGDDLVV